MAYTFGHDKSLFGSKINDTIFEIDQKTSVQNEKELINVVVFMPVIFALHHRHPDDGVVHLAKRLVIPFICAGIRQFLHIDQLKRAVQNVKISLVREFLGVLSRIQTSN